MIGIVKGIISESGVKKKGDVSKLWMFFVWRRGGKVKLYV